MNNQMRARDYIPLSICIVLLLATIVPYVSASQEKYQVNQPINLKLTCTINNAIPSNSATMNLSISYPNGTFFKDNIATTSKGNGIFNYTITFPRIGIYYPTLLCIDGSNSNSDSSGEYLITNSGETFDASTGTMILGEIGLIGLLLALGSSFSKDKWKIRTLFFMSSLLMGIIVLNSIRIISDSSNTLATMVLVGTILLLTILSFMFVWLLINYTIGIIDKLKQKKRDRWNPT